MLNLSFFDKLSNKEKQWMTIAIAGMVAADGVIDKRELNDLGSVLLHMENIEQAERLMTMLKNKKVPKLPMITVENRILATQMLFVIVKVGIVDNSLSGKEAAYLIYAGSILNFTKEFVQSILKWAKLQAELNKFQEKLTNQGQGIDTHDTALIGEYIQIVGAKDLL